uniref:Uncharacterized protein n=1 Tax=Rhizophora mucronata TaxID=61149 RepID=A0A2P2PJW8_RHIMU
MILRQSICLSLRRERNFLYIKAKSVQICPILKRLLTVKTVTTSVNKRICPSLLSMYITEMKSTLNVLGWIKISIT